MHIQGFIEMGLIIWVQVCTDYSSGLSEFPITKRTCPFKFDGFSLLYKLKLKLLK